MSEISKDNIVIGEMVVSDIHLEYYFQRYRAITHSKITSPTEWGKGVVHDLETPPSWKKKVQQTTITKVIHNIL